MTYESQGRVSMTKRHFYLLFCQAWLKSFTDQNIKSAFKKTGIWPYQPAQVLDKVTIVRPITPLDDSLQLATPLTSKGIRRLQRSYKTEPTNIKLKKIFYANIVLAT